MNDIVGIVSNIQHFSIHDGPGIRTTVFLKGCPLKCLWCHNPESISREPLLSFVQSKCINCGACFKVCPTNVHINEKGEHKIYRERCIACGLCVDSCPTNALELVGKKMSVSEVMEEVLSDIAFYINSGGGLTISGGEPLMQIDFTEAILKTAKNYKINTVVETCGFSSFDNINKVAEITDLFLYDYKVTDSLEHKEFTGVHNYKILQNLEKLHAIGAKILLRCPIVPGFNDNENHFKEIARITKEYPNLIGAELLPYHRLGISKLSRFGMNSNYFVNLTPPDNIQVKKWKDSVFKYGGRLVGN